MFPAQVSAILERLEQAGFAAYAVGGCVRDTLLGRVPQDWDVATSARPEQTAALFAGRSIPTGLQHGTVTVRQEGLSVGSPPSAPMAPTPTIAAPMRCISPTRWRRTCAAAT